MLEQKGVEECKFRPEINRGVPNFEMEENAMLLKGMAKHVQQMENARKAKREISEKNKKYEKQNSDLKNSLNSKKKMIQELIDANEKFKDKIIELEKQNKVQKAKKNEELKKLREKQEMKECMDELSLMQRTLLYTEQ